MKMSLECGTMYLSISRLFPVMERSMTLCPKKDVIIKTVSYAQERAREKTEDMPISTLTIQESLSFSTLGS